jgi:hypothetical protein
MYLISQGEPWDITTIKYEVKDEVTCSKSREVGVQFDRSLYMLHE